MVGVKENNRVFGKAVFFQLRKNTSGIPVHYGDAVMKTGKFSSDQRSVGIVGGNLDFVRFVNFVGRKARLNLLLKYVVRPDHGARLVGGHIVKNRKERLAFFASPPVGLRA